MKPAVRKSWRRGLRRRLLWLKNQYGVIYRHDAAHPRLALIESEAGGIITILNRGRTL